MKKNFPALLLALSLLLCACSVKAPARSEATAPTEYTSPYAPVTAVDHCLVEPDVRALMSEKDMAAYRVLMDAMLSRMPQITLETDAVTPEYLLDLLRRSPYYYFVSSAELSGDTVAFTYAYPAEEQNEMLSFIDEQLLRIANHEASPDDNALDVILKVYLAVTHEMTYDSERTDNKQLGSPLFIYPADEIYKALRDKKSLCYGFAYTMRCALQLRGIDCFCVYGLCTARGDGHEWIVFRYDDEWFHCDPGWDRVTEDYAKLIHFGKTDREREVDTLEMTDFLSCHDPSFGDVTCTDDRFGIFRNIVRFSYISGHRFYMVDLFDNEKIFDTETFSFVD